MWIQAGSPPAPWSKFYLSKLGKRFGVEDISTQNRYALVVSVDDDVWDLLEQVMNLDAKGQLKGSKKGDKKSSSISISSIQDLVTLPNESIIEVLQLVLTAEEERAMSWTEVAAMTKLLKVHTGITLVSSLCFVCVRWRKSSRK